MESRMKIEFTNSDSSAKIIQKWWKYHHSSSCQTKMVYNYLVNILNTDDLQELSNKCSSITSKCNGDGAGLTGGTLIDMFLCAFLKKKLPRYSDNHTGECDMTICNVPFSLKKINGKSTIALDWSKNENAGKRKYFRCDIMIINLKSEIWWKKHPTQIASTIKMIYNDTIPSGIYLIDKSFCKHYIQLSNNNKTNTLVESQYLYLMMKRSIQLCRWIELPQPNKSIEFNILHAFS